MEKLIELLNEYEKKAVVHWYEWYWQDVLMCRYIKDGFEFYTDEATTIAISKYYWFIKWLVENDKIDKDKLYKSEYKPYFWNRTTNAFSWFWAENILLMLLAISDTPIEDLISYLR